MTDDLATVWQTGWQDGFAAAVDAARRTGFDRPGAGVVSPILRLDTPADYREAFLDGWSEGLAYARTHAPGSGDLPEPPLVPRRRSRPRRIIRALNAPRDVPVWYLALTFPCIVFATLPLVGWIGRGLARLIA